eukprot:SAG31_NODE_1291_length_8975_cov_26.197274_9_plen_286_part_00
MYSTGLKLTNFKIYCYLVRIFSCYDEGSTPVPGDRQGTLHGYVLGKCGVKGTGITFDTDTIPSLNQDLMSMTQWYKIRKYNLILQHDGFSGLYKKDRDTGEMTDCIPVHFDRTRNQWIFYTIIAADYDTAKRAGRIMENQRKCNSTYSEKLSTIPDSGTELGELLFDLAAYCQPRFLTLRNGDEVVLTDSSEIGGVIDYCTQIGDSQFFAQSAYKQYHEMNYTETIDHQMDYGSYGTISANPTIMMAMTAELEQPDDEACMAGVKAGMPNREKKQTIMEFHKAWT